MFIFDSMDNEYLHQISNKTYNPPLKSTAHNLPLKEMSWDDFELLCLSMVHDVENIPITDCDVYGRKGQKQDGIDIYARKNIGKYSSFQSKRYQTFTISNLNSVFTEFEKGAWYSKTDKFYLCTTADFSDVKLQDRFEEIKNEYIIKGKQVVKWDFSVINRILKTHPLIVYIFFGENWCKQFCGEEIYNNTINLIDFSELSKCFKKSSLFLHEVKNYFEKEIKSHIERKEVTKILDWVKSDINHPQKNILVLKGEKGLGKSVILKDVYDQLLINDNLVLGIKADKYYASSPKELENKLFLNDKITFSKIVKSINSAKKKIVIIIDQLDALSQTLSSNRDYIHTYNRIINELADENNIRVIISSRIFDLNYDAELSKYNSSNYTKINVSLLSEDEVKDTLKKFNVYSSSAKFINLLKTPNHLEIFCKLPNKDKIKLDTISSLKGLYDQLWEDLIVKKEHLNSSELLFMISKEMYRNQQIVVYNKFTKDFKKELEFLLSNQLIIQNNNEIQFFHQTFYEYCFARQFVEKGENLLDYINDNEQSLYVRSIIKMVLEYLREYNHGKYVKIITSILKSRKYRFHIKSLIITDLGSLASPTKEEEKVVLRQVLNDSYYENVFIHSVYSKKWIEYLIEKKVLEKYFSKKRTISHHIYGLYKKQNVIQINHFEKYNLKTQVEENRNSIWVLFRKNINIATFQILTYLDGSTSIKDKEPFVQDIISYIDNWEDKKLLNYFSIYILGSDKLNKGNNFWVYEIIKKIFINHEEYVVDVMTPIIYDFFEKGNEFPHELKHSIEELYKLNPERIFQLLFLLYERVLEENKNTHVFDEIDSPYFKTTIFYEGLGLSYSANKVIEETLINHLKMKDEDYLLSFFNDYKETNSIYILNILLIQFINHNSRFKNEIFELINIIYNKNGFNGVDDNFQLYLRQVIGHVFLDLSKDMKLEVVKILLSIKHPRDNNFFKYKDNQGKEKVHFTGMGEKLYKFIDQLPNKEISRYPLLKKRYQELQRRFEDINSDKATDVSGPFTSYAVGAPLDLSAYEKMSLIDWKKSIIKFNDDYHEGHGPFGGKLEHSRAFRVAVESNPEGFHSFIDELFDDNKVSIDYISAGIEGLINAKYSAKVVQKLYKKLIKNNLDKNNTLYTIWKTDYLINNRMIDFDIITFLSDSATNHSNPEATINKDDPSFDSLNSVRGSAIHKIIHCYKHVEFEEIIFKTVEKAMHDPLLSVRVAIVQNIAFLNHLNLNRSFKIFKTLTENNDINFLKNTFRASQYYNNKFHSEMYPYFDKIIKNKELHSDGNLIVLSWFNDEINDEKLYKRFVSSSNDAKLCAIKIAEANLFNKNGEVSEKALKTLSDFLNIKEKEFSNAYSGMILRKFKLENFKILYPFLLKYSKSRACIGQPRYFLKLLLKCARDYPIECLELISNLDFTIIPNIQERNYYDKEPVQLILAIYTILNSNFKENKKQIRISLNIFDSMLKHNHLRVSANNAIELTI